MATRLLPFWRLFNGENLIAWVYDDVTLECQGLDVVTNTATLILTVEGLSGGTEIFNISPGTSRQIQFSGRPRLLMGVGETDAETGPVRNRLNRARTDPAYLADVVAGRIEHAFVYQPPARVRVQMTIPRRVR